MQVSWIDADEVRDLVALLAEPPARSGVAPDLNTLPESADRFGFEFLSEKPSAAAWQPLQETPSPWQAPAAVEAAIQPDISHIREKLRVIRDRAQEAGLLAKEAPAEAPAPPPLPAPVEVPQPPMPAAEVPAPEVESEIAPEASSTPPPSEAVADATPAAEAGVEPEAPSSSPPEIEASLGDASHADVEAATIVERLDEFARSSATQTVCEEQFMLDDHGDLLWGSPTSPDLLICAKLAMNASLRSQAATLAKPAGATQVQVGPGKELQLVSCPTRHGNITLALVNARQVPATELREGLAKAMEA